MTTTKPEGTPRTDAEAFLAVQVQTDCEQECVLAEDSRTLERELAQARADYENNLKYLEHLRDSHEALRTELAALKAQEPVAIVNGQGSGGRALLNLLDNNSRVCQSNVESVRPLPVGMKLYAAPTPAEPLSDPDNNTSMDGDD